MTTNVTEADVWVYHIEVNKLVSRATVSNVLSTDMARVKIELPSEVQLSSAPLSGRFRITCPIENNDLVLDPMATNDIKMNEWIGWVNTAMYDKCPATYDKLDIWNAGGFPHIENGFAFYIRFVGKNGPQTQMKLVSGKDTPLNGHNITTEQRKVVNASNDLFYDVIPFEMLRTYETKP